VSSPKQFNLPDVGEGLTEAEILAWHVKPGDTVTVNQIIVEIETAKAAVELPCPFAGVVTGLHVAEGATVDVGTPIITVDVDPGDSTVIVQEISPAGAGAAPAAAAPTATPAAAAPEGEAPKRQAVLVGYGPVQGGTTRRARTSAPSQAPATPAPVAPSTPVAPVPVAPAALANVSVLAKPPVRKLAKDLGVDLATVTPTGPNGVITREDVEAALGAPAPSFVPGAGVARPRGEERIPIKGVRKHTAAAMVGSAFTAPHVTEFVTIDATRTMEAVARLKALPEFDGVKVSPLLLVAKAVLVAAARHPGINATWDEAAQEIVIKHYVNLGIAAATPRGLIVPNVKDADTLSLVDLARALNALTATARDGKTPPADMAGGTFTITNIGVFGIDSGTPIINPGESAILAFGAIKKQPWVVDDEIVPRMVTTLGLSFDHRLIDGELGSKFLRDLATFLEDPAMSLLAWS
jgi:pyruvate dehydrogenase E2 component (dihydrolipoamide acetyltransferase)